LTRSPSSIECSDLFRSQEDRAAYTTHRNLASLGNDDRFALPYSTGWYVRAVLLPAWTGASEHLAFKISDVSTEPIFDSG
jgi:hypothetical protein